jgi:hypothetical protein
VSVFTDPLPRNGFYNFFVLLLRVYMLRTLPNNGRCLQESLLSNGSIRHNIVNDSVIITIRLHLLSNSFGPNVFLGSFPLKDHTLYSPFRVCDYISQLYKTASPYNFNISKELYYWASVFSSPNSITTSGVEVGDSKSLRNFGRTVLRLVSSINQT